MTSQLSCLENLPNEILDEIVSYLPVATPSEYNFHHTPAIYFTASSTQNLKNAAQVSSRLLKLVRSRLYAHSRFYLDDLYDFLNFVTSHRLERYITSLVVLLGNDPPRDLDINRLLRHLSNLNPLRITVLAPPSRIGAMLNTKAPEEHNWAFQITHQLCQWERSTLPESPVFTTNPSSNPLDIMAYSSLRFNEGSSLRAYAHYEYFLFEVPSVLGKWGTIASMGSDEEKLSISRGLRHLTSFSYTAIFPFYNHVKLVLDALELMMNLQSFTVQLAPCSEDSAIDLANRGPIDPNDPWMELATGYDIIAHSIIELGRSASLVHFRTLDYQNEALRVELSQSLGAKFKDTEWETNGHGEWTKTASNGGIKNQSSNTGPPAILFTRTTMDSTSNSHAAGPALPTLAHNLLLSDEASSSSQQSVDDIDSSHPPHQTESWNLYADINAGLQASPESAFRAGSVIGFSRLRSENNENTEDDECLSQLPRALLTAHLVRQAQTLNAPNSTAVYIVHPATFNAFSPRRLLASLLNTTTTTNRQVLTRDAAIACLDRVQLFPVFDLQTALQAIHEISSAVASSAAGRNSLQPNKAIVLVAGLNTLAEGVVRTSNAARGAAALTAALRTLTHLTRTGPAAVSVLLVNTSGLGTAAANADYASGSIAMQDEASSRESGVRSAFGANGANLFPSLLMRTLDQGLDTHILVSPIKGSGVVVEVIKDRLGEGIGKWCVWKSI
ncbi:F-box domain protein [Aspergillus brunneoviolaceus CBS 621.78]|uniref:Uncharacterized protein n=1 Tax=Aspergillus brunneoviolaceus CBS 621.78 TaxID=1450534 RepID=A0ACD1G775_9EURO|nr:hypothetical protein BO95DRAFT_453745 [Aspergillus brunneoviolaceus CBS 621.78]RAH45070.1 hypothetical protein BO95DRAFT_453745 [Aspergillus brunneoviolaceus CBS 621.78]